MPDDASYGLLQVHSLADAQTALERFDTDDPRYALSSRVLRRSLDRSRRKQEAARAGQQLARKRAGRYRRLKH